MTNQPFEPIHHPQAHALRVTIRSLAVWMIFVATCLFAHDKLQSSVPSSYPAWSWFFLFYLCLVIAGAYSVRSMLVIAAAWHGVTEASDEWPFVQPCYDYPVYLALAMVILPFTQILSLTVNDWINQRISYALALGPAVKKVCNDRHLTYVGTIDSGPYWSVYCRHHDGIVETYHFVLPPQ